VQPLLEWKTTSITYSDCVFVALGTQNAMRMRRIVICDLSSSTILFTLSRKLRDLKKIFNTKWRF